MTTQWLREMVRRTGCALEGGIVSTKERCLHCCALAELEALEKAAREYAAWHVTPESKRVLLAVAEETKRR